MREESLERRLRGADARVVGLYFDQFPPLSSLVRRCLSDLKTPVGETFN